MKKKNLSNILLIIIFILGLSLVLYPSVSNYYNSFHQTRAITEYEHIMDDMSEEDYTDIWNAAVDYNKSLKKSGGYIITSNEQHERYESVLDINGNGMMGYIEIPIIRVSLPIYHGTDDSVLQTAAGHVEWSSLPIGGEGTHCLISAHRGLPSAKLFTNLDRLVVGDTFKLYVLDEILTYRVDEINVVLPSEVDKLKIIDGADLCTLITCTPYGINTHRLLVRGQRIATVENIHLSADAVRIEPLIVAPIVAIPFILIFVLYIMLRYRKRL